MEKTTFTDLYDDILIEIFSYFSVEEIFISFTNIIPNLSSVIKNSHIRSLDEYTINNVLPYIDLSQVISCETISSRRLKAEQLAYLFRFPHLQSLILRNAIVLENDYSHLLTTEYPAAVMDICSGDTIKLLHCVFNFIPTLKRFHFQANNIQINLRDIQENLSINVFSNIEYLKLDIVCSWSALPRILIATPRLQVLCVITVPELQVSLPANLHLSSLHTLQLTSKDIDLVELGQLLKCMPNLKYCRLQGQAERTDESLTQSYRWRTFLNEDALQLKRFIINYLVECEQRHWLPVSRFQNDSYFTEINFDIQYNIIDFQGMLRIKGDYKR
jgi:hypothetical protein